MKFRAYVIFFLFDLLLVIESIIINSKITTIFDKVVTKSLETEKQFKKYIKKNKRRPLNQASFLYVMNIPFDSLKIINIPTHNDTNFHIKYIEFIPSQTDKPTGLKNGIKKSIYKITDFLIFVFINYQIDLHHYNI